MAYVYILRGTSNRSYIGSTEDVAERLKRHNAGAVHSTRRLGLPMVFVAARAFPSTAEARRIEAKLKRWKNPAKVIQYLSAQDQSSPDASGLVQGSNP